MSRDDAAQPISGKWKRRQNTAEWQYWPNEDTVATYREFDGSSVLVFV